MGYTQLGLDERYQIYSLLQRGWSITRIAEWMRRSRTTIYRELKRNRGGTGWRPSQAWEMALARRLGKTGARLGPTVWQEVERLLRDDWSPQQIADRFRLENNVGISHEWIYRYVYRDQRHGGDLYRHLRRQKPRRKRLGKYGRRRYLKDTRSIEKRPKGADSRHCFGHWEGDTVIGKGQKGALLTLVERKARYTRLCHLPTRHSDGVRDKVRQLLAPIKDRVKTITYDNGREFAAHQAMEVDLEARVYFAHPYASWERGTNENTNGLLRQYFPKKRNLAVVSAQEIAQAEYRLNHRPRKCLGFKTPHEVFFGEKHQLTVALTS